MNSQQFALFALATLCLFSCVLSETSSGSTSGGYLRFSSRIQRTAAESNITQAIIVHATLDVQSTTGLPINTTDAQVQTAINDTVDYLETSYKVPPTNVTFAPDNVFNATVFTFAVIWQNNATNETESNTSIIFLATNTTNVTQQVDILNAVVYQMFSIHINASLLISGINVTNITTLGEPVPFSNGTTTTTSTGSTSTSTGSTSTSTGTISTSTGTISTGTSSTSTNGNTTVSTSLATSLSLSSWMSVGTIVCLVFTYLF